MSQRSVPIVPSNYVESDAASDIEQSASAIGEDELLAKLGITPVPARKSSVGEPSTPNAPKLNESHKSSTAATGGLSTLQKTTPAAASVQKVMSLDVTVFRLIDVPYTKGLFIEVGTPSLIHTTAVCEPPNLIFDETFRVDVPHESSQAQPSVLTFTLKQAQSTLGYSAVKLSSRILSESGYWSHGLPICNGVLYVMIKVASVGHKSTAPLMTSQSKGITVPRSIAPNKDKLSGMEQLLKEHIDHSHNVKRELERKEKDKTDIGIATSTIADTEMTKSEYSHADAKSESRAPSPPLVVKEATSHTKRDLSVHNHASNLEKRVLAAVTELETVSRCIIESEFSACAMYEKVELQKRLSDATVRDLQRSHDDESHQTKKEYEDKILELRKVSYDEVRAIRNEGAENMRQARIAHDEAIRQIRIQHEEQTRQYTIEQEDIRRQHQIAHEAAIRDVRDELASAMKEQEDEFIEKQIEIDERHAADLNLEKEETKRAYAILDKTTTRLINTRLSSGNVLSRVSALRLCRYYYYRMRSHALSAKARRRHLLSAGIACASMAAALDSTLMQRGFHNLYDNAKGNQRHRKTLRARRAHVRANTTRSELSHIRLRYTTWIRRNDAVRSSKKSKSLIQREIAYLVEQEMISRLHIETVQTDVTTLECNHIKRCQIGFDDQATAVADAHRKHNRNYETIVRWLEPQLDYREPGPKTDFETAAMKLAAIAVTDLTKLRKLVQRHQTENRGKYIALANLQSAVSEHAS